MTDKGFVSALPALRPVLAMNVGTGEVVDWETPINNLLQLVQTETNTYYAQNKTKIHKVLEDRVRIVNPAEFARQKGVKPGIGHYPRELKAKSRIEKLVQYRLISEVSSYLDNPNPRKQEPTFPLQLSLGAVDKQMATLGYDKETNTLSLVWKVWDQELYFEFELPHYITTRDIIKFSLPQVKYNRANQIVFLFSIREKARVKHVGKHKAGIDLGLVQPFTLVISNEKDQKIAEYRASYQTQHVNQKIQRLKIELGQTRVKANQYHALKLEDKAVVLEEQCRKLSQKLVRQRSALAWLIATDIKTKINQHEVSIVNVEDLSWVSGKHGMSRWNHSVQQTAIEHSLKREGVRVRRVSPRNSSQLCARCGVRLVHRGRSVLCGGCKEVLDRDVNAAWNLSTERHLIGFPVAESAVGGVCTTRVEDMSHNDSASVDVLVGACLRSSSL